MQPDITLEEGAVRITSARLNLLTIEQESGDPVLPRSAEVGDLLLIVSTTRFQQQILSSRSSLWLCVPPVDMATGDASWREVQLGDPVTGTG